MRNSCWCVPDFFYFAMVEYDDFIGILDGVDRRWAITMAVRPSMSLLMAFWMSISVSVSTEEVASSSTSIAGL